MFIKLVTLKQFVRIVSFQNNQKKIKYGFNFVKIAR